MATLTIQPKADALTFEHELHILPPVSVGGEDLWFAYLDDPTKWRRAWSSLDELLQFAGDVLKKLLVYEQHPNGQRNPNATAGTVRPLPDLEPRWTIKVTADRQEEDVEWHVEILDAAAWGYSDYDLRKVMAKLAERIAAANVTPQLVTLPASLIRASTALVRVQPDSDDDFEQTVAAQLRSIEEKMAEDARAAQEVQKRIKAAEARRRGLQAALAAYRKHLGKR